MSLWPHGLPRGHFRSKPYQEVQRLVNFLNLSSSMSVQPQVLSQGPLPLPSACRGCWSMNQIPPTQFLMLQSPRTWPAWLNLSLRKRTGKKDANVCVIYVQVFPYRTCVLVPCLALLSDSYYLCCLGPNFQFNTWLPWRTPTWNNINRELGVGLQQGDHSACSVTHLTWGYL